MKIETKYNIGDIVKIQTKPDKNICTDEIEKIFIVARNINDLSILYLLKNFNYPCEEKDFI